MICAANSNYADTTEKTMEVMRSFMKGVYLYSSVSVDYLGNKKRRLGDQEYDAARTYVLLNCDEIEQYVK